MANKNKKKRKDLRQVEDVRQQVNEQQDRSVNLRRESPDYTNTAANKDRSEDRNSEGNKAPDSGLLL